MSKNKRKRSPEHGAAISTAKMGRPSHRRMFNNEQVDNIRLLLYYGFSILEIMGLFDCYRQTIDGIKKGKIYK